MRSDSESTLRVAVVCEGTLVAAWHERCLRALLGVVGVEVVAVIDAPALLRRDGGHGWSLWSTYWSRRVVRRSRALREVDVGDLLSDATHVRADDASLIAELAALDLDVVMDLSAARAPAARATPARRGVWSLRPACSRSDFGDAPGVTEILRGDTVTMAELGARREPDPATVVLGRAFLRTNTHSYVRTLDDVLFGAAALPARAARTILAGAEPAPGDLSEGPRTRAAGPPNNREAFALGRRCFVNFVRDQVAAVSRSPQWNVGIVDAPIQRFVDETYEPHVRWRPRPPRGRFLADPFGLPDAPESEWLVESYDYATGRGVISVVDPSRPETARPSALPVDTHASYPYLLRHRGQVYCVPQLDDARGIRVFRSVRYPDEWEDAGVLIADVTARDPTAFEHDGRWWLTYTDAAAAFTDLHVWWADDLFGTWHPHAANPVKIDARSARPAGTPFVHDGRLYRPAQDCSREYGGAVAICRVDALTPTDFREEVVRVVRNLAGTYRHGTHTLASVDGATLVDGKRLAFTFSGTRRALASRVQRTSS
jgi:hypothetical protein